MFGPVAKIESKPYPDEQQEEFRLTLLAIREADGADRKLLRLNR